MLNSLQRSHFAISGSTIATVYNGFECQIEKIILSCSVFPLRSDITKDGHDSSRLEGEKAEASPEEEVKDETASQG